MDSRSIRCLLGAVALYGLQGCSSSNFTGQEHSLTGASPASSTASDVGTGTGTSSVDSSGTGTNTSSGTVDQGQSGTSTASGTNTGSKLSVNGGDGFISPGLSVGSTSASAFRFGLLINEPKCAMCHLTVNGDVVSTAAVNQWNIDAAGVMSADNSTPDLVSGQWLCASTYSTLATDDSGNLTSTNMPITVAGGVQQNYTGPEMPALNGQVQFPQLNLTQIQQGVTGTLTGKSLIDGSAVNVAKVYNGNLTITGDKSSPMTITSDVYVTGDLVIKGYYTGVGSIYVGGRIYIPADLRAVNSVFPYPSGATAALAKAQQLVASQTGDALALATPNSIFIADLTSGLYDDSGYTPPRIPADAVRATAGVNDVYSWYPGGQQGYSNLYEPSVSCADGSQVQLKSFNLVEAFLYSANTIGGISRGGSWAINGGMITNSLHIIGSAGRTVGPPPDGILCPNATISPVHGLPMNSNYVNYDYRMAAGLRLLSKLSAYYTP